MADGSAGDSSTIFSGLNDQQIAAVKALDGPVLILAGAGSGKTKCLTHRLAYLVETKKAQLNEIVAITFTNKASQELSERILRILGMDPSHSARPAFFLRRHLPWVGTFHSLCVRLLRLEAEQIGLSPQFTIFDSDDALTLIRRILKDKNLDSKLYSPNAIRSIISNAKNELMSPDQYRAYVNGHFQEVALEVYRAYEQQLRQLEALDFDDLIGRTVKMLEDDAKIRTKYHQQFKYVMIDEYQDTNHAQYKLSQLLTNPATRNLCVVGDDFQSIYGWRGANFKNILNFTRDFSGTQVFKLEQNYRSTKTILQGANHVIEKVRNRSQKKLWTDNESGVPITIFEANSAYAEADFIAGEIRSLRPHGYGWKDFAVLQRTNAQTRIIEEVFLAEGVPYRLIGALRFYERKEIKDLLAYLRFLLNPQDIHSLARAINIPPRGIGPKTIEKKGEKYEQFLAEMETLRALVTNQQPVVALEQILKTIKYRDYVNDGTLEGESRWENVEELKNLAMEFEKVEEFLEHVALVSDVDNFDSGADAVTVMTLHASKGLEFTTVFLTGCEEGLFPHLRALDDESQMDEERRLCYVGMTRARKRLYMTHARQRMIHGGLTYTLPSRFLNEIDGSLVDRV